MCTLAQGLFVVVRDSLPIGTDNGQRGADAATFITFLGDQWMYNARFVGRQTWGKRFKEATALRI